MVHSDITSFQGSFMQKAEDTLFPSLELSPCLIELFVDDVVHVTEVTVEVHGLLVFQEFCVHTFNFVEHCDFAE